MTRYISRNAQIAEFNSALKVIADNANRLYPECDIQFRVGKHFVDRVIERYGQNFTEGIIDVVRAIRDNICIVVYYRHLDTILPDRGRIQVNESCEIRGNIIDNCYVLSTFINSDIP